MKDKAALFWEHASNGQIRCTLCPHLCVINEGSEGLCRARGVRGGKLASLTYAHPASIISDEIEMRFLYHFHPGTRALSLGCYGCNVLCRGCQNWQISHAGAATETTRLPSLSPQEAVAMARKHKLAGVAFTYNDPVVWIEYVHDVSAAFKKAGFYTAFISAGYITKEALDYVAPFIDAFKFDLKARTPESWACLSKVKDPSPAFDAVVRAQKVHKCHIEVVSNIVPSINDSETELKQMANWIMDKLGANVPWHVTRFIPNFELSYLASTPVKTLERAAAIGKAAGLRFVYIGNVQGHMERNTSCPACGRTVIQRGDKKVEKLSIIQGMCDTCGENIGIIQ